jgi:hypothetical protein
MKFCEVSKKSIGELKKVTCPNWQFSKVRWGCRKSDMSELTIFKSSMGMSKKWHVRIDNFQNFEGCPKKFIGMSKKVTGPNWQFSKLRGVSKKVYRDVEKVTCPNWHFSKVRRGVLKILGEGGVGIENLGGCRKKSKNVHVVEIDNFAFSIDSVKKVKKTCFRQFRKF